MKNLVMIGNSGHGKTHIAIGISLKACASGMSVLFKNAAMVAAFVDWLTFKLYILDMNGESYRLEHVKRNT